MTNIRATIQNFYDSEKVVNSIDTLGGSQQLKISDKTLSNALDKPIMYQNCYYKNIGSKIKCF